MANLEIRASTLYRKSDRRQPEINTASISQRDALLIPVGAMLVNIINRGPDSVVTVTDFNSTDFQISLFSPKEKLLVPAQQALLTVVHEMNLRARGNRQSYVERYAFLDPVLPQFNSYRLYRFMNKLNRLLLNLSPSRQQQLETVNRLKRIARLDTSTQLIQLFPGEQLRFETLTSNPKYRLRLGYDLSYDPWKTGTINCPQRPQPTRN